MLGSVYDCGPCPYQANKQFHAFVPEEDLSAHYRELMDHGFRRNGDMIYMTHCPNCQDCKATRVAVDQFSMRKDQKRCWKKNQDLSVTNRDPCFDDEHQTLFQQYELAIHQNENAELHHLLQNCNQACKEVQARDQAGHLIAVTIIDIFEDAVSSVYCYYHPDHKLRSLGTFMALQEIEYCQSQQKEWLYLGFYVANCQKLAYKARFRPIQLLENQLWTDFTDDKLTAE